MKGFNVFIFRGKLLICFLSFLIPCFNTHAQRAIEVDGIFYERISDNEVGVTYNPQYDDNGWPSSGVYTYTGNITIPESITYKNRVYKVTQILDNAFRYCYFLDSVSLPCTIDSIGKFSFRLCTALNDVQMQNNLKKIGLNAFIECYSLTSIVIPNSVTSIGGGAFSDCTALESVTLPENITTIEEATFRNCSSLTSIIIPNSVKSIGGWAFSGSNLSDVSLGDSVENINDAFCDCPGLKSITIPNTVTDLAGAFAGCQNLTSVTFLGEDPKNVGHRAFYNSPISEIHIPSLKAWNNLQYSVHRDTGANGLDEDFIFINSAYDLYFSDELVTDLNLSSESGVFTPFAYCKSLKSVVMSSNILEVGHVAFKNCKNLKRVTFGRNVEFIGCEAFYGCDELTDLYFLGSIPPHFPIWRLSSQIQDQSDYDVRCSFKWSQRENTALHVPIGSKEAYSQSVWNDSFSTDIDEFNAQEVLDEHVIREYHRVLLSSDNIVSIRNDSIVEFEEGIIVEIINQNKNHPCLASGMVTDKSYEAYWEYGILSEHSYYYNFWPYNRCFRLSLGERKGLKMPYTYRYDVLYEGNRNLYLRIRIPNGLKAIEARLHQKSGIVGYNLRPSCPTDDFVVYLWADAYFAWSGSGLFFNLELLLYGETENPDGVKSIDGTSVGNSNETYNLAGQKVNQGYKGVIIKNGKKYLQH